MHLVLIGLPHSTFSISSIDVWTHKYEFELSRFPCPIHSAVDVIAAHFVGIFPASNVGVPKNNDYIQFNYFVCLNICWRIQYPTYLARSGFSVQCIVLSIGFEIYFCDASLLHCFCSKI